MSSPSQILQRVGITMSRESLIPRTSSNSNFSFFPLDTRCCNFGTRAVSRVWVCATCLSVPDMMDGKRLSTYASSTIDSSFFHEAWGIPYLFFSVSILFFSCFCLARGDGYLVNHLANEKSKCSSIFRKCFTQSLYFFPGGNRNS
jgi:hypothetical protein